MKKPRSQNVETKSLEQSFFEAKIVNPESTLSATIYSVENFQFYESL